MNTHERCIQHVNGEKKLSHVKLFGGMNALSNDVA